MFVFHRFLATLTIAAVGGVTASASGAVLSGPDALPPTIAAYAVMTNPPASLAALLDHPQRSRFEQLPQVIAAKKQPEYLKFKLAVQFFELKIGETWRPAIEKLTRHGLQVAFDAKTEGVVLLARGDDPKLLGRIRDAWLDVTRKDARDKGRADPVSEAEYRGVQTYQVGDAGMAIVGDWLVAANKSELGKEVLDRLLGDDLPSLSQNAAFRSGRLAVSHNEPPAVWTWVDLDVLRSANVAKELFQGHAQDFNGELILGGVLTAINESGYATIALDVRGDGVNMTTTLPRDQSNEAPKYDYYFGVDERGAAPPVIQSNQRLGAIRAHRDIAALWRLSPDIFGQEVNAGLAKAESDLSTLFGGKSFSDEILASLGPEVQLVFARQGYDGPTPAIKLPAGAAVFRLISPETSQRAMKVAFQTIIGFVNLDAGQKGRSPLLIATERVDDATVISTAYDRDDASDDDAAEIQFNFSPTIAFQDQWLVLSSTRGLALDVVANLSRSDTETTEERAPVDHRVVNTAIELSMPELAVLLSDNRENLIAQNMLEEGRAREEAEVHVETLESIVQALQRVELELVTVDGVLRLDLNVELAD